LFSAVHQEAMEMVPGESDMQICPCLWNGHKVPVLSLMPAWSFWRGVCRKKTCSLLWGQVEMVRSKGLGDCYQRWYGCTTFLVYKGYWKDFIRHNRFLNLSESRECALIPSQWDNLLWVSGKTSR